MSIQKVHLRKWAGKVARRNISLPFRITQIHYFALEPTQRNIRAHPKLIIGGYYNVTFRRVRPN